MAKYSLHPPLPTHLDIEPTTKCNFRCKMCQRTYWHTRKSVDMSIDNFCRIIDSIPTLQSVKIQGMGEPLLNKDFLSMIKCAKERGLFVFTYTNGSLLSKTYKDLIESRIDLIRISFDASQDNTLHTLRPGSDLEAILSRIQQLVEYRNKLNAKTRIELWTVITKLNFNETSEIVKMAASLKIDALRFQLLLNTFTYIPYIDKLVEHLQASSKELRMAIDLARSAATAHNVNISFEISKSRSAERPCHWPFDSAYISAEGYVVPCCTIANPYIINLGNALVDKFSDIWHNTKYVEFRKSLLSMDLQEPCKRCYSFHKQYNDIFSIFSQTTY